MSQNVTQNAETAEENAERKKKKKRKRRRRRRDGDQLKPTQAVPDPGRRHRPRSRRDPIRCAANPGCTATQVAARLSLVFFFFFSFFSDEHVGAALVVFFVFFLNVNRVLETRFPYRRHLEKVLCKRGTTHENRALKARFRSPKSSL